MMESTIATITLMKCLAEVSDSKTWIGEVEAPVRSSFCVIYQYLLPPYRFLYELVLDQAASYAFLYFCIDTSYLYSLLTYLNTS